jgi:hypothetical protein
MLKPACGGKGLHIVGSFASRYASAGECSGVECDFGTIDDKISVIFRKTGGFANYPPIGFVRSAAASPGGDPFGRSPAETASAGKANNPLRHDRGAGYVARAVSLLLLGEGGAAPGRGAAFRSPAANGMPQPFTADDLTLGFVHDEDHLLRLSPLRVLARPSGRQRLPAWISVPPLLARSNSHSSKFLPDALR